MTTRQHLDKLGERVPSGREPQTLYQTDFYAWTQQQAARLRDEDFADLDLNNLIEEIESMGASEQRELENRLVVLLRHLLKLSGLPDSQPARGWRLTVKEQRQQLRRHLKRNPSLRPLVADAVAELYADALDLATDDLANDDLADANLPVRCPWTAEQVLDVDWLPQETTS